MSKGKIVFLLLVVILALSGCNSQVSLPDVPINPDDITQIQIVLAMGNPEYGAESKIITDRSEIEGMVNAFNELTVGDQVDVAYVHDVFAAHYYFFTAAIDETDEIITYHFSFNGNDTERIWINKNWYWVCYADLTPFELYQASSALEIRVDKNLIEMQQP